MTRTHRLLLSLGLTCCLSFQVAAEAPVVDDSENFALLDDQQAAIEQPLAKAQLEDIDNGEEIALAQDNTNHTGSAGLLDKLQGMQQELQELRGQLEVQSHDLKLLQQQQLAFYKDLDARLRNNPTSSSATPTQALASSSTPKGAAPISSRTQTTASNPIIAPTPSRANPADEQISYLAAYDLVKNKHFDEALSAMHSFVSRYPQGGYTANAQYWLGELYLVKRNYPKAIEHFETVLNKFSSSSKVAASTLKLGYALAASGKIEEARVRLQQVLKNYPDTPTAKLALTKLESLGVS